MHHVFYLDGNTRKVSWIIHTENSISEQSREHVEIYKDRISNIQSKYIALHIGLFWGIGVFIIKNQDHIKIKLDDKEMFDQITNKLSINDEFINKKIKFINQLITQRKLKVEFELIQQKNNPAKKILDAKELKTKNG
ncbi:reverse transcriptase-like protein [Nitrosopumilus sp.]|uniref:reverse transcriptase-like protein n=1 Tax=Nitrosopumilus sp. TaxID=2024843 RepID=UPI00247B9ECA|nr:reverse transcriptase-like protein [Nitrosopumilus sp.]MCV0431500.1 reverse transcriptase-like protein [Nitrosopumilus sp.]